MIYVRCTLSLMMMTFMGDFFFYAENKSSFFSTELLILLHFGLIHKTNKSKQIEMKKKCPKRKK